MPTRAIYFDLGNVLLGFSHERMFRQLAAVAGVPADVVHRALFDETHSDSSKDLRSAQWLYEVGLLDTDGYYEHFCAQTGTRPDRRRLEQAACDIFWTLEPMIELARNLAAAGYPLGILSNINTLHWS